MSERPFQDRFKILLFIVLVLFILIYFSFKAFDYFSGPVFTIYTPTPYEIIKDDTFLIFGNVKHAKNIYINEREITINENGDFGELLINKYPYTLVTVKSVNKYGKTQEKVFFVGKEK